MSFNYGREEKKWRLWKEAEEKQLRSLGRPVTVRAVINPPQAMRAALSERQLG